MSKFRIIPKLEIKSLNVVKGMRMEGLRVVGDPLLLSKKYLDDGADEIFFVDTVASLYNRKYLNEIVSRVSNKSLIPITAGGGLRCLDDIQQILRNGADKISINTIAHNKKEIITESCKVFGSQSIVVSIQAKYSQDNNWEAFYLNGRERSFKKVDEWCKQVVDLGAGEIILTSVDYDGTKQGPDKKLIEKIVRLVPVPIIAGGGVGSLEDILWLAKVGVSGVALANTLHFSKLKISQIKSFLKINKIDVSIR